MEASAGGGSILVEPGSLDALSGRIAGVATGTSAARGGFAKAANAAAGCQEPAAFTFTRLQTLLNGSMEMLDLCSTALSKAVKGAAGAYVTTDVTQMAAGSGPAPEP
ncbi:MAG TPA: hypothetical protein VN767_06725 [Streptosporangiaceae bacterium]|jgi:hypothetical protein|nr:hypothetical protein [Streptosporangiaceae bacterium]